MGNFIHRPNKLLLGSAYTYNGGFRQGWLANVREIKGQQFGGTGLDSAVVKMSFYQSSFVWSAEFMTVVILGHHYSATTDNRDRLRLPRAHPPSRTFCLSKWKEPGRDGHRQSYLAADPPK